MVQEVGQSKSMGLASLWLLVRIFCCIITWWESQWSNRSTGRKQNAKGGLVLQQLALGTNPVPWELSCALLMTWFPLKGHNSQCCHNDSQIWTWVSEELTTFGPQQSHMWQAVALDSCFPGASERALPQRRGSAVNTPSARLFTQR